MSNNRGNITLARKTAFVDIAKYMKDKLIDSWASGILRAKEITKLNKEIGL